MRSLSIGAALAATWILGAACHVSKQPQPAPERTNTAAAASSCDATVAPPGAMFPSNFDYPQPESTIQGWPNGHRQRLHAYCLFAGLNYPWMPSTPTWRTWKTTSQIFQYQYNPWPLQVAGPVPEGTPAERTVPINQARARASGPVGKIVNPPPVYYVNAAVANNQRYKNAGCLQAVNDSATGKLLGYTLRDGQVYQSNGDIMVAAVSYSPFALQSITGQNLYNAQALNKLLPQQPTSSSTNITRPMDKYSIVLKVMLWPVSSTGVTALPYWNWNANPPGSSSDNQYAGYEMQRFWTQAVAISSAPNPGGTQTATFLYGVLDPTGARPLGPNTYPNAQVVGLNRFYSKTYSASDLGALAPCDQAILDASAYWAYNRGFQDGDSLAMVAMHIMTKEQTDWTFQSAWWHPDALNCNGGRFCTDQPASVPGGDTLYKNYNMSTTYGQLQQSGNANYYAPPDTKQPAQVWPVAYNPYIELAASHPITTNCMNCHHRAAWPPNINLFPTQKPDEGRFSAYLQNSPPNPNALEQFQTNNAVFNGLTMVDSMWAISDRAGYPASAQAAAGGANQP